MSHGQSVGIVLSGGNTRECSCQLLEGAEKGGVREGQLVVIRGRSREGIEILARIGAIVPYNDFFTEGDPWSEARRKDIAIPSAVARQYEVCRLELLREIGGLDITYPPRPGDLVSRIDPERDHGRIFDIVQTEGLISFGSLAGYESLPIPLRVENVPMHLAVFGVTGSGKSFSTGVLLERLLRIQLRDTLYASYPAVIIDANGDYTNYANEYARHAESWKCGWLKRFVFPGVLVSSEEESANCASIGISLDEMESRDVAELILQFYKGTVSETSELQLAALQRLLEEFREDRLIKLDSIFTNSQHFDQLRNAIRAFDPTEVAPASRAAIERAVRNFRDRVEGEFRLISCDSPMKNPQFVDLLTLERGVAIIDFSGDGAPGVDLQTKQLIITYLASVLFRRFTRFKIERKERYLLFLIEEAQNFCPSPSYPVGSHLAKSRLTAIATQGRKFGLSLCLVSQRPSFLDAVVLSMCNSFVIHRLSADDVEFVRRVTGGLPASLQNRLTSLRQGEFVVSGQLLTVPFPLLGRVDKKERLVHHTAGTTRVLEALERLMTEA